MYLGDTTKDDLIDFILDYIEFLAVEFGRGDVYAANDLYEIREEIAKLYKKDVKF